ncbi:MAG TPA: 2-amino-4-hydroxy-6-hydroxymethyldihydropteridine diphosphokinase [Planctomycetaceae bacterium]|nr:2-amino-4-hydroxy-6-hydroxymethyldihydropteridine diphosphokinase [Planctomycetaceae bacterium]
MSDHRTNRAYLSLGSNIEPEKNLPAAVRELAALGRVLTLSSVWESAPFPAPDAPVRVAGNAGPSFLNAAVLLETELSAPEIYDRVISVIERKLGRVRDPRNKNAPRTIDIDLSLFNNKVLEFAGRRVPDPDILKRPFVAVPLAELDPDYVHPIECRRLAEIAMTWKSNDLRQRADVKLQ